MGRTHGQNPTGTMQNENVAVPSRDLIGFAKGIHNAIHCPIDDGDAL